MSFKDHHNPISEAKLNNLSEFILLAFTIRTQAHLAHLVTKSYSHHLALQEFYECLLDNTDLLAEQAMGQGVQLSGTLNQDITYNTNIDDVIVILANFRKEVSAHIEVTSASKDGGLNGIFVSIQSSIDMLLYKLQLN